MHLLNQSCTRYQCFELPLAIVLAQWPSGKTSDRVMQRLWVLPLAIVLAQWPSGKESDRVTQRLWVRIPPERFA